MRAQPIDVLILVEYVVRELDLACADDFGTRHALPVWPEARYVNLAYEQLKKVRRRIERWISVLERSTCLREILV
jgi:hypothetical protein